MSHNHGFNRFMMGVQNPNAQVFFTNVMGETSQYVGEKHLLHIKNYAEDHGQDDYMEDYDWEIQHHPDCPRQMEHFSADILLDPHADIKVPARIIYVCELAHELTKNGLTYLQEDWLQLEVGTYTVALERSATMSSTYGQHNHTPYSVSPEPYQYRITILE